MLTYFPKSFSSRSINIYLGILIISNLLFISRILPLEWWISGIMAVCGFFFYSNQITKQWQKYSSAVFLKKLFKTALILRVVWVFFSYLFYTYMTGQPFEFDAGDAYGYHSEALWLADLIKGSQIEVYYKYINGRYSDMGYAYYLGWQYWLTGGSIIIARLLKAVYSAYTCVLIYKLANRSFGEEVGRMAAIFCMLMPNLIYYTGLHLKETEMVLFTVAFMERADIMLRNKKFNLVEVAPPLILASSLFFFRTVLGATALFALFSALVFSSSKLLGFGKRVVIVVWLVGTTAYFVGGRISDEVEAVWRARQNTQEQSMNWRATMGNGNKFAKYASGAVFAPLIFAMPFPTVIHTPFQNNQQLINGGNYVKNIMAFFALFCVFWLVKNKKWQEHILVGSFTIGYLLVLAFSSFAQAERFHMPVLPFILMMAAFGVSKMTNKTKKYFNWYTLLIFFIIVGWSWFKLAGRGLA